VTAPESVRLLAEARAAARAARDFAGADRLREEIAEAGWTVHDGADGWALTARESRAVLDAVTDLPDRSGLPDDGRATVSLLVEGWPDDVRTSVAALITHLPADVKVQALDLASADGAGAVLDEAAAGHPSRLEVWHVAAPAGWAAARRAMQRADTAAVHVWCDPSTVFDGDALAPLLAAFADRTVAGAGWQGVNVDLDDDWRSFHPAGPGEVDALLGYLFAVRRSAARLAGGPDPKARFYRNADMEFSFMLRETGAGRLVVPDPDLPCHQGRHRGYHDSDPDYRDRESRRNYRRFLRRYRGRTDLLAPR